MPWTANNQAAYNQAAYNQAAYNQAAYNQAAYNQAAYNQAAYNQAAYPAGPLAGGPLPPGLVPAGATGAGNPSGSGFLGGYGPVARFEYATPAALGPLPWTLEFSFGNGWPGFPFRQRINPYDCTPPLEYTPGEWDPGLRFWTLPFDDQLTEWLQDLNLAAPAVMAAREYARRDQNVKWLAVAPGDHAQDSPQAAIESDPGVIGWRVGARGEKGTTVDAADAWRFIDNELSDLVDQMRDDRSRFLAEAGVQSGNPTAYFVHLLALDPASRPWTVELMNCASAIANMTKMQFKAVYRRARPSTLLPALVPPWGPPQHPAFPSGHSMVAHLTALFLLSVPGIAARFGIFETGQTVASHPVPDDFLGPGADRYGMDQHSPLLWLAWRIAKGRERLGLHYPSDGAASRRLAAAVWRACLVLPRDNDRAIHVPTLDMVLRKACAEWTGTPRPRTPKPGAGKAATAATAKTSATKRVKKSGG